MAAADVEDERRVTRGDQVEDVEGGTRIGSLATALGRDGEPRKARGIEKVME